MTTDYQRIVYPERAEYLAEDGHFKGYRIFLDHWSDITAYLQESFEVLSVRRFTKALIIYGAQGCGKSVLANKILGDFESTRAGLASAGATVDANSLWHRIVSGPDQQSKLQNIRKATLETHVLAVENQRDWVSKATSIVAGNTDRTCLVIADNCERDYFIQGLLGLSDAEYLAIGRTSSTMKAAAHKFVELCRTSMKGCFFVFFTNDQDFALQFDHFANEQHKGLLDIRELQMPNNVQKEAIVRINVNRLNPFSYWFCLDRAGPDEKAAVWDTLRGADTFPASFASVDRAIRSSSKIREGKPARKSVLNLFTFSNTSNVRPLFPILSNAAPEDVFIGQSFGIRQWKSDWAELFDNNRDQKLLASEWNLKIIIASDAFVAALLAGDPEAKRLIDLTTTYHAPGTWTSTKDEYAKDLHVLDSYFGQKYASQQNTTFWAKGGVRSHDYEQKLKEFYPTYNTKSGGFLSARPDLVLSEHVPCSILKANSKEQATLNAIIRREAQTVEFTAIKEFTMEKAVAYLREQKLQNYILAVQEQ